MKQRIILVLLLLACVGFGLWFNKHFEFYDEVVDLGWSAKAHNNEFLAAEQYLHKLEFYVDSSDKLLDFETLPADATVLLASSDMILSERQLSKLLDWLQSGGHLIVGASYAVDASEDDSATENSEDLLLQRLGLKMVRDDCGCEPSDDRAEQMSQALEQALGGDFDSEEMQQGLDQGKKLSELLREKNNKLREKNKKLREEKKLREKNNNPVDSGDDKDEQQGLEQAEIAPEITAEVEEPVYPEDELTHTSWHGFDGEVALYFDEHYSLEHDFFYEPEVGSSDGDSANSSTKNSTNNSAAIEPVYWSGNKHGVQLVQFDWGSGLITVLSQSNIWHSESISRLDHALQLWLLVEDSSQVLLLHGTQMPSLMRLIWRHGAEAVVASAILLLAWLCYRGRRFGKVLQPQFVQRRSMLEHIEACAQLLWREGHDEQLLEPLRAETRRLFNKKHPALHALDDAELFTAIANISGIDKVRVKYAFLHKTNTRERDFKICVSALQKIRNSL